MGNFLKSADRRSDLLMMSLKLGDGDLVDPAACRAPKIYRIAHDIDTAEAQFSRMLCSTPGEKVGGLSSPALLFGCTCRERPDDDAVSEIAVRAYHDDSVGSRERLDV